MMASAIYLADTSVYVHREKHPAILRRYEQLVVEGRLAVCQLTTMECLNGARDPQSYEVAWSVLHGLRWLDVTTDAMNRALTTHRALASTSQHLNFRLQDLIIAATAELNGATVLHYDADYDRIAAVTGQPTEWVAPRGSL